LAYAPEQPRVVPYKGRTAEPPACPNPGPPRRPVPRRSRPWSRRRRPVRLVNTIPEHASNAMSSVTMSRSRSAASHRELTTGAPVPSRSPAASKLNRRRRRLRFRPPLHTPTAGKPSIAIPSISSSFSPTQSSPKTTQSPAPPRASGHPVHGPSLLRGRR
jgi:hypothetical protein